MKTSLSLCFVVGLLVLAGRNPLLGKDPLSKSDLVAAFPKTTEFVVFSHNVKSTYSATSQSKTIKQFSEPVWDNVLKLQTKSQTGSLLNPRSWFGIDWKDAGLLDTQGAVVGFRDQASVQQIVFVAKLGPKAADHELVKRWIDSHGGKGKVRSSKVGESVSLYTAENAKQPTTQECLAIGPEWTCLSTSPKAIEEWNAETTASPFVDRIKSAIALGKEGDIAFWGNPWSVFSGATEKSEPKAFLSGKRFGLEGLEEVQGVLHAPSNALTAWRLEYRMQLPKTLTKGLALLHLKSGKAVTPPKFMGSSTENLAVSYVDIKPWFQGVNHVVDQLIDEETPGSFGDLLDSILSDPEGPKIDIRQELIYRLGPLVFQSLTSVPDKNDPGRLQQYPLFACALQDPKTAIATLDKLFGNDEDIKTEKIGAAKCWYTTNDESLFVSLSNGDRKSVSIAAIEDATLYLATDVDWFRKVLATNPSPAGTNTGKPWEKHFQQSGLETFSIRQTMNLQTWLEASWTRLPEKEPAKEPVKQAPKGTKKKDAKVKEPYQVDLLALVLTKVLVPGLSKTEIPKWDSVRSTLGSMSHSALRDGTQIQGQIWVYE